MKLKSYWSKDTVFSETQLLYLSFSERPFLKILLLLCLPVVTLPEVEMPLYHPSSLVYRSTSSIHWILNPGLVFD